MNNRLLKNAHLRRSPHPSSLQRTFEYASLLRISGALHLGIFDQLVRNEWFNRLIRLNTIFNRQTSVLPKFYNFAQHTYLPLMFFIQRLVKDV